jgi:hypothetical protein
MYIKYKNTPEEEAIFAPYRDFISTKPRKDGKKNDNVAKRHKLDNEMYHSFINKCNIRRDHIKSASQLIVASNGTSMDVKVMQVYILYYLAQRKGFNFFTFLKDVPYYKEYITEIEKYIDSHTQDIDVNTVQNIDTQAINWTAHFTSLNKERAGKMRDKMANARGYIKKLKNNKIYIDKDK